MTPHTEAERAAFEAWARGYGTWEVKRDDDVALGTTGYTDITLTVAWHAVQAARRAPAAPVPQSEPVAYLWQHCETGRTRVVMPDMVVTADANWIVVGPLYLAAAPRLPEAAPVELPEPVAWRDPTNLSTEQSCTYQKWKRESWPHIYTQALYTEQQVRDLLAAHGIGKDKA